MTEKNDTRIEPRLLSRKEAAEYCGMCTATFSAHVRAGRLPGPILGKYDRKAIDYRIDELSGLTAEAAMSPLEKWRADAQGEP